MRSTWYPILSVLVFAPLLTHPHSSHADSPRFLFGTPQLVEGISNPGVGEGAAFVTSDERELFFEKYTGEGSDWNIYVARRDSKATPFGPPVAVGELNNPMTFDGQPSLSSDDLTIYYGSSDTPQGTIWTATRPSRDQPFSTPVLLFDLRPDVSLTRPSIASDDRSLYIQYRVASGPDADIYSSHRANVNSPWGELQPVPELSDPDHWQSRPFISADSLSLFFYDNSDSAPARPGGEDLAVIVRPFIDAPWSKSVNLGNAINTKDVEDFATLSADEKTFYFTRYDASAADLTSYWNSADIWQASVLPFETAGIRGSGGVYQQNFESLGTAAGTNLPNGWTFTANDIVFNNATTERFPATRRNYAGVYNAGLDGDVDHALVTDYSLKEGGELDFRALVQDAPLRALRLGFDLEAWQLYSQLGDNKGEAAFHVVLEADTGSGFSQVADLGTVTTGATLSRPATGNLVNGNDPAYRVSYDSGPLDVNVPPGATLRVRWMSTEASQRTVVFGLDNVALRFAAPGDANIDGVFNSTDLVQVFQRGEYEDTVVGNSTWSDGDWTNDNDNEFDSGDLVAAFQDGKYVSAATLDATSSVPEPASWVLMLIGTIALSSRRERHSHLKNAGAL